MKIGIFYMVTVKYFEIKFCRSIAFNFQVLSDLLIVMLATQMTLNMENTMKIVIFLRYKNTFLNIKITHSEKKIFMP